MDISEILKDIRNKETDIYLYSKLQKIIRRDVLYIEEINEYEILIILQAAIKQNNIDIIEYILYEYLPDLPVSIKTKLTIEKLLDF